MKYKHALFLYPYIENSIGMCLFPPTGLEYVATSAKDHVGKVTIVDLRYDKVLCDTGNLMDFIRKEIDIICVSVSWNRQVDEVYGLLNLMPDGIPLVVGGYKATEDVEEIFKRCPKVGIIARGEGEETIKEIARDEPLEKILGISYRAGGKIIHNKNRPLPDINTITPPDRSLRQYEYSMMSNDIKMASVTFDTILSSRGCPFNCKFCTFNMNPLGQKRDYASRDAESVVKEIEGISADIILFSDDNFFTEPKRSEEICDLLIARKIKKRFIAQTRIDLAEYPELLKKTVKAGFKMLLLGIESPHDRILTAFNKGFDQATIRKRLSVLRELPIIFHGYFIYGNLSETEEEMLYIAKFAKEIGLDSIAFSKLRVDKYSPLKEIVKNTPGYHLTVKGEVYSDKYSHSYLKKIHRKLRFSFYTPFRVLNIAAKILRVRFFTFREIMSFAAVAPLLLSRIIRKEIKEKRLVKSIKQILGHNK
ncbi:MAG: radical SAM protein [Candidatus Omnitrophica bacterium]|nr:radical SAM protein [Candidatus Omnitrophota bacterium]